MINFFQFSCINEKFTWHQEKNLIFVSNTDEFWIFITHIYYHTFFFLIFQNGFIYLIYLK